MGAAGVALLARGHFPAWFHNSRRAWLVAVLFTVATGAITWTIFPMLSSPLPTTVTPLQIEAIREVDKVLAGKDEAALRDFFEVPEMVELNVKSDTQRLRNVMATDNKNFPDR